ncbi:MAG: DUF3347 domain-containing protein [Chitinophagaceae bacterium]|nr:DUF3347 domain-containing protein [Chitinophagaceae bacterium]
MKKLLAIVFLVLVLYGTWWLFFKTKPVDNSPKQVALKVGIHSAIFNKSITDAVNGYMDMQSAFVDADSVRIKVKAQQFIILMDSVKIGELRKDTTGIYESAQSQIGDIKNNDSAILKETDLTEMRQDFRMVSENLYPLLKTIHYEGPKLYWQNCPMAFGEGKDANWISNTTAINNPYLGKNHPEYKGTMLHCGEIKDTIK